MKKKRLKHLLYINQSFIYYLKLKKPHCETNDEQLFFNKAMNNKIISQTIKQISQTIYSKVGKTDDL